MREVNHFLFNEPKKISAESASSFSFQLDPGFILVGVFYSTPLKSYCICSPIGSISFDSILATPPPPNDAQIKIIYSAPELSPAHQARFDGIISQASQNQLNVTGSAIRLGPIKGNLQFSENRIQIEKSASQVSSEKNGKKIRVLIVDDSKTIRDLLTSVFSKDDDIQIVATAEHPSLVENLIQIHKPDVITLDIHMPDMDGVTLLRRYIVKYPIPTIMISSITYEDGPYVLNALESGAVDYIQKPSLSELSHVGPLMIEKIKAAARSKVQTQKTYTAASRTGAQANIQYSANSLVVIGSSTGGTEALKVVFSQLPENIPPILVVQHIPPVFSKAFADRLNTICPFSVKEAADGDLVVPNQVLIAPGGLQMEAVAMGSELRIKISDSPPMNRHKPSVDFLFDSVGKIAKQRSLVAVILTGMGADGARGMKVLFDLGAQTIAQNEQTSVVYGMPKEAVKFGGVEHVLPLGEIGNEIVRLARMEQKTKKKLSA